MLRFAYLLLMALLATTTVSAQSPTPVGTWRDASGRVLVRIYPCDDRLCGKLVWFKWPNDDQGLPLVDLKNADPALRARPLLGLTILRDLRRTEEDMWEEGEIYNPIEGEDYHARMWVQNDGTLRLRIYELFPVFGETHIWTRIQ